MLVLLPILLTASFGAAQDITGSIAGAVVDATGAGVPEVTVTITSVDRNQLVRSTTTDGAGSYAAPLLPVGQYSISVEARGFKKATQTGATLNVNDKLTVNFRLEVGDVLQEVTVTAPLVAVELQSSAQSTVVSGTQIRELALVTRNYEQLVALMPGVSSSAVDQLYVGISAPSGTTATIPFAINGARNTGSAWTVDGADNMDRGANKTLLNTPSVDAIKEFKVQRSSYSAEFGRTGGGLVSVVTKSGSNQFHGDAYEFVRNDAFAANNFLNNANRLNLGSDGTAKVPPLRYNNFGWTLGGPVWIPRVYGKDRNKTFFFFSQEFRRVITYTSVIGVVPTAAEINGNFPHPICASYTGSTCNQIAQQITTIDPVAQQYIKDIFSKLSLPVGTNSPASLFRSTYNFEQELVGVDHAFNEKHRVFVRYIRDHIPTVEPGGLFTGAAIPNVGNTSTNTPAHNWVADLVSTFSPTWLNEVGFNYSYGGIFSNPTGLMAATNSPDIKVPVPFPVTLNQVPNMSFTGGSSLATFGPYHDDNRNYAVFDNVTKIRGAHTLKFGFVYNYYQKSENAGLANAGAFSFVSSTSTTPAGGATLFEQAFANFLTGNVATFTQASLDAAPDIRAQQWELYAQDDWRVKPNLTVNVGLRYSMFRQPIDDKNELTTFDPALYNPATAAQLTPAGLLADTDAFSYVNGISINNQTSPHGNKVARENNNNWAPRVGFAWDPFKTGKTSLRAGYGVYYDATLFGIYEQNIFNNPPYVNTVTIPNTILSNPAGGSSASVQNSPKVLRGTAPDWNTPNTQQWSLDIQRQFTPSALLSVAYVGTKATHLLGIVDINSVYPGLAYTSGLVPPSTTFTSANETLLNRVRPYQGYNSINQIEPWFNSNYNALQIYGQKRFRGDSLVAFSYTWSKNLTNNWSDRSNAPQNAYNTRGGEYGLAMLDRRHVFTADLVYNLPFYREQKGLLGKTLGGWEVSGVLYFNTGVPGTVTTLAGTDPAGLGIVGASTASPRPNMVCDPNQNAPHTRFQWFNAACFQNVPAGVHVPGNAGVGVVEGPGFERVDLALFKSVAFKERYRFQLRWEATNAFNHANPNAYGSLALGSSIFNQITSYRDPRIIQLGAKFYF
jgi:outer membrane receptor protein involved in Fe transport